MAIVLNLKINAKNLTCLIPKRINSLSLHLIKKRVLKCSREPQKNVIIYVEEAKYKEFSAIIVIDKRLLLNHV